ncbi:MAG: polysaccharide biosynthesis/export family protein [Caulobacteraceae bacterium]
MNHRLRPAMAALAIFAVAALGAPPRLAAEPAAGADMVTPTALSSASAGAVSANYRIGPADRLDVNVFQIPDLSGKAQVDASGNVLLPLVGQMKAAGLTAGQLSDEIAADLKTKYVKDPLVTVTVLTAASQTVTVDGAVAAPGIYPLVGPTTLLQAIALAKGPDDKTANEHKVALYRLVNGQRYGAVYDLAAIRAGTAPDPQVEGRDIVVVPGSRMKSFWNKFVSVAPILALARPF